MKLSGIGTSTNALLDCVVIGWWRQNHPRNLSSDVIPIVDCAEVISVLNIEAGTQLVEHSDQPDNLDIC